MKICLSKRLLVLFFVLFVPVLNWKLPGDLIQVQIIVRHGARTPLNYTYPNDPYINFTYTPYILGQLTLQGKKQAFHIGQIFRERYQFKNVSYQENLLNLTVDEYSRVQETAIGLATSLWPPISNETVVQGIPWQPVPYTFLQLHPFDGEEAESRFDTPEFQNAIEPYQKYKEYIMNNSGITDIRQIDAIYSSLCAQDYYGLELPIWTKEVYPEPIRTIDGLVLAASAFDPKERETICKSIREFANIFRMTVENNNTVVTSPLNIHVNHDQQIAVILQCMNVSTNQIFPDYVGHIALELYRKPYVGVKLWWHQGLNFEPTYLEIEECGNILCPFDTWYKIVTSY